MKHNIDPVFNQYFSCHQILLATYATYQNRDYDMIFAESWGFWYQKGDNPFGISLYPGYQKRRELLLEKFHGIKIQEEKYTNKESLMELIQKILLFSPVMLFCDVFDCPWNMSYKRNHIDHYILIIGLSDDAKQAYVLDPYSTKEENIVDIDKIVPDNGTVSFFITKPVYKLQVNDYYSEIVNSINHIENSGFFYGFESFYNEFQIRFEEVVLSAYTDVYAIPLIIELRRIANQRHCYCIFLNRMIKEKLIDPSMLNIMKSIAEKYSLLRILLIKQIIKKKTNTKECSNVINEIINNEYEAYEKMKSFI